jgi:hypothetical protein
LVVNTIAAPAAVIAQVKRVARSACIIGSRFCKKLISITALVK